MVKQKQGEWKMVNCLHSAANCHQLYKAQAGSRATFPGYFAACFLNISFLNHLTG